jgi:hypothetical protein
MQTLQFSGGMMLVPQGPPPRRQWLHQWRRFEIFKHGMDGNPRVFLEGISGSRPDWLEADQSRGWIRHGLGAAVNHGREYRSSWPGG